MSVTELVGALVGLSLTLMVFSYLLGDNFLFRLATHIFIGVAAGYAAMVAWYNVLWPLLLEPLIFGSLEQRLFALGPLLLGALMLTKISPRLARLGNPAMAFLVGVGAAVAIGGAVQGTLFPQVFATAQLFSPQSIRPGGSLDWLLLLEASLALVGTVTTLIFFQFTLRQQHTPLAQRNPLVEGLARIGHFFIAVTLGAVFAGVYAAALTALVERLYFITTFIISF
jgi:hypothetical protein